MKPEQIKEITKMLNAFKAPRTSFSRAEFMDFVTRNNISYKNVIVSAMLHKDIIVRDGQGMYRFTTSFPIHYSKIQDLYDYMRDWVTNGHGRRRTNKVTTKVTTEVVVKEDNITEAQAVRKLKSLGYKLYKYTEI